LTRTSVPDPTTTWINIFSTYDAITTKLNDGTGTTQDQLTAIDYWQARLREDRASIAAGGHAHTH
jgi:hypothetical protein